MYIKLHTQDEYTLNSRFKPTFEFALDYTHIENKTYHETAVLHQYYTVEKLLSQSKLSRAVYWFKSILKKFSVKLGKKFSL